VKATVRHALEFADVSFAYGGLAALENVSFAVEPREIACLLGRSGCGKTTLLRLAAGLDLPASGRILLGGQEVCGPNRFVPPELRGVGLMFQDYALFPHLTVADNVAFGLRRHRDVDHRRSVAEALARVGLSRHASDFPHMLSGGEQQRVALARALAPAPRVMLMDEPFSNLDQRTRTVIRNDTVALLRSSGITTLVVTHDPSEAIAIADRIVLMRTGRVAQIGTPSDLYLEPRSLFAARFFSDANEFDGLCRAGEARFALGLAAARDLADGPCRVVVRPHDLALVSADAGGPPGRVTERRFMGEFSMLQVALDGEAAPVWVRVPIDDLRRPGDRVALAALRSYAFPAEG
jgi:iron(III) transport system ATP-binding protein